MYKRRLIPVLFLKDGWMVRSEAPWCSSTIRWALVPSVMRSLGLRKMHATVVHNDTPQIRGMVNKISHLLQVEEIEG